MTARVDRSLPTIDEEARVAAASCRECLDARFADLDKCLPGAPTSAEGWFALLSGIPGDRGAMRRFSAMRSAGVDSGRWPPGSIECFAILQAYLAALPRLASLPLDESVKRLYCATSRRIDCDDTRLAGYFDYTSDPFSEMAKIATLRRFTAGQLSFDITTLPRSWMLKVHPLALPGLVTELITRFGGFGPFAVPHLCYLRPNPLVILQTESRLSFWRIAKTLELQPQVKGVMAASWFYSPVVGEHFPHLAWVRNFFVEQGAYLVEMEIAEAGAGFLIGSAKRRRLYEQGRFRPRQTLVLWHRAALLDWAAAHPEFGDDAPRTNPAMSEPAMAAPMAGSGRQPATSPERGGRLAGLGAARLLNARPKTYILVTLIAPAMLAALVGWLTAHPWAALPSFVTTAAVMWLVQYFFLL